MRTRDILAALLLLVAGLQTASAQGFRVYKSDGTFTQFSFRTDSIVFYEGAGEDVDFGPFTPVNQCIVGTWYKSKTETVSFNNDGTTDYIDGATYEFMPYQGTLIICNAYGVPVNILKVHKVTKDKMIVSTLGGSTFKVWSSTPLPQQVEEIVLNETSLSLEVGTTAILTATVLPENADNKTVEWKSSNTAVAIVVNSGNGEMVVPLANGTCTITCSATDGSNVYAECQVTVGGDIIVPDEHEWVDLGLPSGTLWATCNIGANSPEEYGDYFAWGETIGYNAGKKTSYTWTTYKYCKGSETTMTKYCTDSNYGTIDNKTELDPEDDAATVAWGENWQMPSCEQMEEIAFESNGYIIREWTTVNGVVGVKITSKINWNSIFLPSANRINGEVWGDSGAWGCYWTRSLISDEPKLAARLWYVTRNEIVQHPTSISTGFGRYMGLSVRPVRKQ